MKFTRILFLFLLPVFFFSCKAPQILPYYLDNVNDSSIKKDVTIPDLKIQKNDLLSIQVFSISNSPEQSDVYYNQPVIGNATEEKGYLVDNDGNILHHRLGLIHAEGLTKKELAGEIKRRLTEPVELLTQPTIIIRFMNFHVNILGQVKQEGPVTVPGERLTIFEAIGLAGGITDYGEKDSVKVFRETDGKREIGMLDLSSPSVFESPFYHLKQNDQIIVGTTNKKYEEAEQARTYQKISFALTLVTVAATLANIFIR